MPSPAPERSRAARSHPVFPEIGWELTAARGPPRPPACGGIRGTSAGGARRASGLRPAAGLRIPFRRLGDLERSDRVAVRHVASAGLPPGRLGKTRAGIGPRAGDPRAVANTAEGVGTVHHEGSMNRSAACKTAHEPMDASSASSSLRSDAGRLLTTRPSFFASASAERAASICCWDA